MYLEAVAKTFNENNELVALCDSNQGRLALAADFVAQWHRTPTLFMAEEFDALLAKTQPDVVIVVSPCASHDDYIIRALDAGCDVITEKPLTTTAAKAQAILAACKRNQRHVRVAFNYRYSPSRTQVKELLMSNAIGEVLSIDCNWQLNTLHGADYFRRWHSHKSNSGGLMVHKATHHFDLVNWWLQSEPESVYAQGSRRYYTADMARRLGLKSHHERCHTCPETQACAFHVSLAKDAAFKAMYLDHEHLDGYFRDACVFRPDIDIEDSMSVAVRYKSGAHLTYSLNAYSAAEGYRIGFNGTHGRIEHSLLEHAGYSGATAFESPPADIATTRIISMDGRVQEIPVWQGTGGHSGGDNAMLRDMFGRPEPDKYLRASDERAGTYSMLVGVAANLAIERGHTVKVSELIEGLEAPQHAEAGPFRLRMPRCVSSA